jgi:hypothetical protein
MELRVAGAITRELMKEHSLWNAFNTDAEREVAIKESANKALPLARAAIRSMRDLTPEMIAAVSSLVDVPLTERQARIATRGAFLVSSGSDEDDQTAARGLVVDWAHLIDAASPEEL